MLRRSAARHEFTILETDRKLGVFIAPIQRRLKSRPRHEVAGLLLLLREKVAPPSCVLHQFMLRVA